MEATDLFKNRVKQIVSCFNLPQNQNQQQDEIIKGEEVDEYEEYEDNQEDTIENEGEDLEKSLNLLFKPIDYELIKSEIFDEK